MARSKKTDEPEQEVVPTFLETVSGKLPTKDSKKLKEIRDRISQLSQDVIDAQCHHYGLKRHVYFQWRQELEQLQSMFDTP